MSRYPKIIPSAVQWCLNWLNDQLASALPGYCAFCQAGVAGGVPWCADCYASLPWNASACVRCAEPLPPSAEALISPHCGRCLKSPPVQTSAWVPLRYEGQLIRFIQRYKFSADARSGEVLIELMASSLGQRVAHDAAAAVIGVPGQRERTLERGFDHTAWLTRRLAQRLELPVVEAKRVRETPTQRGLDRVARRRNVKDAFTFTRPLPSAVLIVDDVMTTGATLESLALACRHAGAKEIVALAFARTPSIRI